MSWWWPFTEYFSKLISETRTTTKKNNIFIKILYITCRTICLNFEGCWSNENDLQEIQLDISLKSRKLTGNISSVPWKDRHQGRVCASSKIQVLVFGTQMRCVITWIHHQQQLHGRMSEFQSLFFQIQAVDKFEERGWTHVWKFEFVGTLSLEYLTICVSLRRIWIL